MNQWKSTDQIVYRLPDDPPGIWRHAGTVDQLEREYRRNQQRANVAMLADALIATAERGAKSKRTSRKELA